MKEIIIDGVDVAGCNFRLGRDNKQKCECCHATGFGVICDCENWHNCYYKQLKRLEQENEKIKRQYNCYACGSCNGTEDYINLEKHHLGLRKVYDRLRQENAELKADLKSLEYTVVLQGKRDIDNATDLFAKHIAKIESENSILKAEKAKYYQQTLDDEIQINELLQTLQEIKKIVEGIRNATYQFGQEADQKFFNETLGKILQKITKSEVGE